MGKERFLKELGLSPEVAEPGKAKSETIRGDSESEDKKPSPPAEEKGDVLEAELEVPQLIEESADHPTEQPPAREPATKLGEAAKGDTGQEGGAEGNLMESGGDGAAPKSTLFLGRKADDELEPGRATLAAATVLPLSLLGSKKTWVWIAVLVCLAIVGYLLIRWYSGRGDSTSPPKQEPQTVEEFMRDF